MTVFLAFWKQKYSNASYRNKFSDFYFSPSIVTDRENLDASSDTVGLNVNNSSSSFIATSNENASLLSKIAEETDLINEIACEMPQDPSNISTSVDIPQPSTSFHNLFIRHLWLSLILISFIDVVV